MLCLTNNTYKSTLRRDSTILIKTFMIPLLLSMGISTNNFWLDGDLISSKEPYSWAKYNNMIAHGFGAIDGHPVTNSLEAFEYNYNRGYRLFETDLILTSDNMLVARHDWNPYMFAYLGQNAAKDQYDRPLSLKEFKELKIHGKYHPLDVRDIVKLLQTYPDAYIITDTKGLKEEKIRNTFKVLVETVLQEDPDVLDRFIPQIYNRKMYKIIKEYYDFNHVIYTLYQSLDSEDEIVNFALENNIQAVTLSENRVNQKFIKRLSDHGIYTYIHTINIYDIAQLYVNQVGLSGVYSDYLTPQLPY